MTTLAPAPLVPPGQLPSADFDPPLVSFFGRSLTEYIQCFALDPVAWRGRDVLDVAAGSSSFAAEACARRIDAVAVDPFYGSPTAELARQVERAAAKMGEPLRAKRGLLHGRTPPSVAAVEADRHAASLRFLGDYETHFCRGRYVSGSLPLLPFFNGTFDLVLCAHLLFTAAARLDFDWHLAACRELVRVSVAEVRIHPLGGPDGRTCPGLARLRRELRAEGIASQIIDVDGDFCSGANSTLILRRAAP